MKTHSVEWTPEKVTQFWDFMSRSAATDDRYFSKMVGHSLIKHVRRRVPLHGRVLDFGCGPGHLMERLLQNGIPCEGVDSSHASVAAAQQRLEGLPGFRGVTQMTGIPTPFEAGTFGTVFFVETIEHLLDAHLFPAIEELHRLLFRGGHLVVTTPNGENLAESTVMCPDCGATFHRMQHLRSWSPKDLDSAMTRHGFRTVWCRPVYFTQPTWASRVKAAGCRLARLKLPHLLYAGQKR